MTGKRSQEETRTIWVSFVFRNFLDREYDNPSNLDYEDAIFELVKCLLGNSQLPIEPKKKLGRPGRTKNEKLSLFREVVEEKRLLRARGKKSGVDKASQAVFERNNYGKSSWNAIKSDYQSIKRQLKEQFDLGEYSSDHVDAILMFITSAWITESDR